MALHFYIFVPVMRHHLFCKTTLRVPVGQSFIAGFTVLKQNNLSMVICVAMSPSLGWRKNTWGRRAKVICCHVKRSDIAIQYTRWRLFCFYILLFNGFKSFQAEINMYLLLYFIILNHILGIDPTATQNSHEQHLWHQKGYNVTSFYCSVIILVC